MKKECKYACCVSRGYLFLYVYARNTFEATVVALFLFCCLFVSRVLSFTHFTLPHLKCFLCVLHVLFGFSVYAGACVCCFAAIFVELYLWVGEGGGCDFPALSSRLFQL